MQENWVPTPAPSSITLFKGPWDASTNTPDIKNYPGLANGYTWIVTVAGNYSGLDAITSWEVGDYALYSNGNWYKLASKSFGWGLTGNAGTISGIDFVGTIDQSDLVLKANDSESVRLYWTGGSRLSGSVTVSKDLQVVGNITGSHAKLAGDLEVCGGDITTKAAEFNLLLGAASRINMGNAAARNWLSGTTLFPQGISGSHTQLVDGTSAFIADVGILISTASNGAVSFKLSNTGSAGTYGTVSDSTIFSTDAQGRVTSAVNAPIQVSEAQVVNLLTDLTASANALVNLSSSLTSEKADKTTSITAGLGLVGGGNLSTNRTLSINDSVVATISGSVFTGAVKFNQGLSGSLTTLANGSSYLIAGNNILVTSASNGPVTVAFNAGGAPANGDFLIYSGTTWTATSPAQAAAASYQSVYASEAISAGDVCYVVNSGGSGNTPTASRAQANSLATVHGVIGLATGSIPKNTYGTVQTYGQLIGPVDTHLFNQGDPLYVSATTPGALTNIKPAGPNYAFQVGIVTRQGQPQNVTTGIVFVSPMQQTDTQNISDIVVSSATDHDGLMYDPASSTWKNARPLWVPETQTALTLSAGATITASNFLGIVYLPIKTAGGANITLSSSSPIALLTKTNADYGRELWLHNVDNNRSITIPAGGSVKLDGSVNLVLAPGTIAKFLWTGLGGNGAWIQTEKAATVG